MTEIKGVRRVAGGTEIIIPEFDLTAAVVFTSDLKLDGKVVKWQDHTRYRVGELAAQWAYQQAQEQYRKTPATHARIGAGRRAVHPGGRRPPLAGPGKSIEPAQEFRDNRQWDVAYREARRAPRPLRVLMRERLAAGRRRPRRADRQPLRGQLLLAPLALAAGARTWRAPGPAGTALPVRPVRPEPEGPEEGAAVSSLPGWTVRQSTLDEATNGEMIAAIVNSDAEGLEDKRPPKPPAKSLRTGPDRVGYRPDEFDTRPHPNLGTHTLMLAVGTKKGLDKEGKLIPPPQALERTFLAVDSAAAQLPPGLLVRVSFWAKVPLPIQASADGVVVYDSAGGEPLGVRITWSPTWKHYHLYRRVPASGKIAVTFALTGLGTAFFDDVRIEPMVPGENPAAVADPAAIPAVVRPTGLQRAGR